MKNTEHHILHIEQMQLIDKSSRTVLVGALATAVFYSHLVYQSISLLLLIAWFSLTATVYIGRYYLTHYRFKLDSLDKENSYRWEMVYLLGTLLSGIIWGMGAYFMLPHVSTLLQAALVLTVGGLVAASSVTYSPSRYLGTVFSVPALVPLVAFFFEQQGDEYFYMGFLVLVYLFVMFISNQFMHRLTRRSIMLGRHNECLVVDLKQKVDEVKFMATEMSYQASHDMLTGLINRREFETRLEKAIKDVSDNQTQYTLCYIDLDEFKVVNDTCGHVAGDVLLKNLTEYFKKYIRSSDILARLGGDEFGLLLPSCDVGKAEQIAENLREAVKNFHFSWEDKIFELGISVGLVEITPQSGTLADVLKAADSACYIAKDLGRNRIHVYVEDDSRLVQRLGYMHSLQAIQRALTENRFVLHAQKISSVNEGEKAWHGEILVRMQGENNKLIFPGDFIPAAERYHLMVEIDKWVVRNAFVNINQLEKLHDGLVTCAINLSGHSLCDRKFLEYVVDQFSVTGISPSSVCFEITETAMISNMLHAERFLEVLRGMGCCFSLDDFGSGLSSFGYLKRLSVDFLKIDGDFVRNMLNDKKDYAMVKSINQIGKEMGMKTIAEFVESEDIKNALLEMQVDYVQGYAIARPVPLAEVISAG